MTDAMSDRILIRTAELADVAAIGALHARVFGPGRFARSAYRVREGRRDGNRLSDFCHVAVRGNRLIASITLSDVKIGGVPGALLLGPIAVDPEFAGQGYGRQLIAEGLQDARTAGNSLVILVGDESYYGRLGFVRVPPGQITLPGPVNPARLLAHPLQGGAIEAARGLVSAAF
jgi:predicted N-acetyltransferase YhbS